MGAKRPNVGRLHDPGLTFEHLSTLASHNGARVFFNQRNFTALPQVKQQLDLNDYLKISRRRSKKNLIFWLPALCHPL